MSAYRKEAMPVFSEALTLYPAPSHIWNRLWIPEELHVALPIWWSALYTIKLLLNRILLIINRDFPLFWARNWSVISARCFDHGNFKTFLIKRSRCRSLENLLHVIYSSSPQIYVNIYKFFTRMESSPVCNYEWLTRDFEIHRATIKIFFFKVVRLQGQVSFCHVILTILVFFCYLGLIHFSPPWNSLIKYKKMYNWAFERQCR